MAKWVRSRGFSTARQPLSHAGDLYPALAGRDGKPCVVCRFPVMPFLECFHLADCYTVIKNNDDIMIATDQDYATRSRFNAPTLQPGFYTLPAADQKDRLIQRRRTMNTPEGYWVGTADGAALRPERIEQIPVTPATEILLCSDGFAAAIEAGLCDWPDAFKTNLSQIVTTLRQAEQDVRVHDRVMRIKTSDDATAITLRFGL